MNMCVYIVYVYIYISYMYERVYVCIYLSPLDGDRYHGLSQGSHFAPACMYTYIHIHIYIHMYV